MSALGDSLLHIGKRPQMYFSLLGPSSCRSLSLVSAFISGFQHGQRFPTDSLEFGYFTQWVAARYRQIDGPRNGLSMILEKMNHDEALAFEEFSRLLPEFLQDFDRIGREGIEQRYAEVMEEIRPKW